MSKKSATIANLIESFQGQRLPAHYLGYFACFNRELFYESHDVLEELWLANRSGSNDGFYKGLIQFAGAFVHLQKNRLRPAAALFRLSQSYLRQYPSVHQQLDVARILQLTDEWLMKLEAGQFENNPLAAGDPPKLELLD